MRLWPLGWWLDTCGPPVFGDDAHLSEDAQKRAIQRLAEEHGVKVEGFPVVRGLWDQWYGSGQAGSAAAVGRR